VLWPGDARRQATLFRSEPSGTSKPPFGSLFGRGPQLPGYKFICCPVAGFLQSAVEAPIIAFPKFFSLSTGGGGGVCRPTTCVVAPLTQLPTLTFRPSQYIYFRSATLRFPAVGYTFKSSLAGSYAHRPAFSPVASTPLPPAKKCGEIGERRGPSRLRPWPRDGTLGRARPRLQCFFSPELDLRGAEFLYEPSEMSRPRFPRAAPLHLRPRPSTSI